LRMVMVRRKAESPRRMVILMWWEWRGGGAMETGEMVDADLTTSRDKGSDDGQGEVLTDWK